MLSIPCSQNNDYVRELCLGLGEFSSDFLLEFSVKVIRKKPKHITKVLLVQISGEISYHIIERPTNQRIKKIYHKYLQKSHGDINISS